MRRILSTLSYAAIAIFCIYGATGCESKTTTVEKTEQVHESEPRMVSPGKEVVE